MRVRLSRTRRLKRSEIVHTLHFFFREIKRNANMWVAIAILVGIIVRYLITSSSSRLYLVRDSLGNESLVVRGTIAGVRDALFMIDTAYAGAPVVSTSYLSVQSQCGGINDVQTHYLRCMASLKGEITNDDRHRAVRTLVHSGVCRSFTSGCTQRLMGIGATQESQSDMLLCPAIGIGGTHDMTSDVLMTHPLRGGIHILTTDYLLHRSPCVLRPGTGRVYFGTNVGRHTFEFHPAKLVGGAFVVPMRVGDDILEIVVDTGAAAALSLAPSAVARLRSCRTLSKRAYQSGVNGERVCSDVLEADVWIGRFHPGRVEVFANSREIHGCDGYAGMGLLRAFDLWLQPDAIGFRSSGLSVRASQATVDGVCDTTRSLPCAATSTSR